jgi:hypothetical protein
MIISGGQTGADIAGLVAAEKLGIKTGGFASRDFMTEKGPQPALGERFELFELQSTEYPQRTKANVIYSDATILFCHNPDSAGSNLVKSVVGITHRDLLIIDFNMYRGQFSEGSKVIKEIRDFLNLYKPRVLNIAGNRESIKPGISSLVKSILVEVFNEANGRPESAKEDQAQD